MAVTSTSSVSGVPPAPVRPGSVLIIGNFLSQSIGNRSVCEDLAERLPKYGWQVSTTSHWPGRIRRLVDMLSTAWRTREHYWIAQVDLYSGPAFFWAAAVCALLRMLHKPYVLTLHGGNLPEFSRRRPWMTKKLLQSAAAVTAPSGYLLEEMSEYRADIQVLPNAITLSNYPFVPRNGARPRLVWVRAFHHIYHPELAVRVLARLKDKFPEIERTMAGPDKGDGSFEATQALAKELGVEKQIKLLGRIPKNEIAKWINAGDIFLNTSSVDNTPVTVLEAMACGACVVTTKVGGIPYLCSHGTDSMLGPAGDVTAMAANVARVLSEPELASSLSRNARSRVELLDWSAILPRWSALLCSVASQMT
jgi:glycosyltransferase involved in cell wall biosynthesis